MYYIYNKCTVNRIKTCYSLYRIIRCSFFHSNDLISSLFKTNANHIFMTGTPPISWESVIIFGSKRVVVPTVLVVLLYMSKLILSLSVSCLGPSYEFGYPFISWEKGRSVLIVPIKNYHIKDSGAGYRRPGNLAFLLNKSKKFEQNRRKHLTKNKALPI